MNSSQGKPNYQHFTTSDLKFEEYCDGTAKIYGKACAVGGTSNDCIDIVYNLSGRTQNTPLNSPKANSCTTYGNDLYYYTTAEGTISGVSGGIYNGMEINISDTDNNGIPAFQLGTGANVNTNNFGASGWYEVSFVSGGTYGWSAKGSHGDFNFNLDNIVPFELEATVSASSVCLDGSATFNAQFKGEVPTNCNLNYTWKAPGGATVSSSQSFTINDIQVNQSGTYTVTVLFTSGGKTCTATATVDIVVDSNCGGTPVCLPNCDGNNVLVKWDLNACNTGTGGNWYGEFTAQTNNQGCGDIEATTVYRVNPDVNKHSCADGMDGSDAMCINGVNSTSAPGQGDDKAVRFSTTITPGSGKAYNLAKLTFNYKRSGYQCNDGGSRSLKIYVYRDGVKVHDQDITGLTKTWKSATIDFGGTEDFVSDAAATYDFEIVGFNPTGGCTVWEIDNIKLKGCCGTSVAQPVVNVSNANICLGESATLTASNCSGTLLWNTGATTSSITVSPTTTTSYTVTCALGSCSAEQSVTVTVDPNCNNNVCLTCNPLTVVKWNLNDCLALSEAYTYSEFLPDYPNSGNFASVTATNVYRENPSTNFHSCVVGFTGQANSDRAMCISASLTSSADWNKALKFSATFNPSQTGDITALKFNQRATPTLNYSPEPASSGGSASNNYPTKYSLRIYKGNTLVYESLNRSTSPTNWTTENIDLSADPDFEFSSNTTYSFELTAFSPVGNGVETSAWDIDNIEIIACNKSTDISVSAENNSPFCEDETVTLTATSSTSGLTYSWAGPAGFTPKNGVTVTTTIVGTYTVTAIASNGCSATATTVVTNFEKPNGGQIGYDETKCVGYHAQEIVNLTTPTGENCGGVVITGDDICENGLIGKPTSMTFQYNGESCSESVNNQGTKGGKWDCNDSGSGPNGDTNVYVVANDGQFSGNVALGSEFTLTNGNSNLSNPVEISIYSQQGGTLLQYVEVHTSCSAPIVIGDQFGSLVLNATEGEGNDTYGGTGGIQYTWESKMGTGNWTLISDANGLTYDPGYISTTTQYRRVTTNCCGSDYSNIVTKTVNPGVIANAGGDQIVCSGGEVTLTAGVGFSSSDNGFLLKTVNESTSTEDNIEFEKDGSDGPRLLIYQNGSNTPTILFASQRARIESKQDHWDHNHDDIAVGYDGSENDRSLLDFDLSGITGDIDKAELVLRTKDDGNVNVGVYPITAPWNGDKATWERNDQGINWNTLGALNPGDPLIDTKLLTSQKDYAWDVTSLVDVWVNGIPNAVGNYSYLWNTGATTQSITVSPSVTTTYTVTVTDNATGCLDSDQAVVEVSDEQLDPGEIGVDQANCGPFDAEVITSIKDATGECGFTNVEDCCDLGNKPIALDFRYNGGSTQDSQNNQGDIGGKWDSSGDAADDPEVYIEVNNGDYFSGTVPEEL